MQIMLPRFMEMRAGASESAGVLLQRLGLSRPLIVADDYVLGSGLAERPIASFEAMGYAYQAFSGVVPDPTTKAVEHGLEALLVGDFDCLIAIGGGSPIDTAKAMAVISAHGGAVRDYQAPAVTNTPGLPVIAIPTTAGTGSEVTRFAVITDSESGEKMLLSGAAFMPIAALVDFELTMSMPMRLTADTGIDSLTHAIEAFVSRKANLFSSDMAQLAMTTIAGNIRAACDAPENRSAREAMMRGATLAGIAFSNASVALVHGMSRPIGSYFHVPHGLSNAMLLPGVTAFSLDAAPSRYAQCARFMGAAMKNDSDREACAKLITALERLNRDLDVPSMSAYGIEVETYMAKVPTMVEDAIRSGSPANNPRVPVTTELAELYRDLYS